MTSVVAALIAGGVPPPHRLTDTHTPLLHTGSAEDDIVMVSPYQPDTRLRRVEVGVVGVELPAHARRVAVATSVASCRSRIQHLPSLRS